MNPTSHINNLIQRYPSLAACREDIFAAYRLLEEAYASGHKLLVCGNGGSAADAGHIVGELMKGFRLKRGLPSSSAAELVGVDPEMGAVLAENLQGALPAIALTAHTSLTTAIMNDNCPALTFAQQVHGLGAAGDCFLGISTSGNSMNVVYAGVTARAKGLRLIGLTGESESRMSRLCDVCIRVPERETYKVQELHLPVYHCLCMMLEDHFFEA